MILSTTVQTPARPAIVERNGAQGVVLTSPQALKIQTVGPEAAEWLHTQCPPGKRWEVTVWVRVREQDA